MTKRSLFKRLLLDHGHTIRFGNDGRVVECIAPVDGDDISRVHLPGFTTFVKFWNVHYRHVIVPRPREDICNACFQFANAFRHQKRIREEDNGSESEDSSNSNNSVFSIDQDSENIITAAALHVDMARKQRELTNIKRQAALDDKDLPNNERCVCYVGDYAQNGYIPSLCGEQPGDTYYFSPMNAYTFGLVDASTEPKKLWAYMFLEGESKKGANSVVSFIQHRLDRDKLGPNNTVKELNLVFDNCAGQNKNKTVMRYLLWVVAMKYARVARAIFLVKGHTKNDCDRLFNLLKINSRKANIWTPQDLIDSYNMNDNVCCQHFLEFYDWDTYFNRYMKKTIPKISSSHIFTCDIDDEPHSLSVQQYDGAEKTRYDMMLPQYESNFDWVTEMAPEGIDGAGLSDIKWLELHSKWGEFVPPEKKRTFRCCRDDPGKKRRDLIRANMKVARQVRAGRMITERSGNGSSMEEEE